MDYLRSEFMIVVDVLEIVLLVYSFEVKRIARWTYVEADGLKRGI